MTNDDEDISNAINTITETVSNVLLQEFLKLPKELQINLVLIKSAQLLLANILCHAANSSTELNKIIIDQAKELRELTVNCAFSGFSEKFAVKKH